MGIENTNTHQSQPHPANQKQASHPDSKAPDAHHLISVQKTPSKGLGIFAEENIPRGTRVIAEPLLLSLDGGSEDPNNILRAFEKLSNKEKELYLQFHGFSCQLRKKGVERYIGKTWSRLSSLQKKVISIYDANGFDVGVFYLASRINHSCIPNIHYEFNESLQKGTYHAVRDIEKGEELYLSYINGGNRTREQRQPKLDQWGFKCNCPACEDSEGGRMRDKRRKEMFELDQKLAMQSQYGTEMNSMEALKTATKLASIQLAEGLLNRELRVSYHDAAKYSLELRNVKMALLWAEKELEHERICLGEDHPVYKGTFERVKMLEGVAESSAPFDPSIIQWF
ncbi:TPR domain protein [Zopfia rhizophila CBS 207.26]|uniref:TPR domain protein n=1 Tax=Zopfia rhizophila CBS 207.26 TaxID=1314779 RepID=A0A6A6ESN6_9PEZI|nr:TPR domain protein [Zopfia rhizophila CBS 207.26]